MVGGIACPEGRDYLALARAGTASHTGEPKLIDPDRSCMFQGAAFDRVGIVAAEGCEHGDPEHGVGSYLGDAYILQYTPHGQLIRRMPIKLGLEQAVIATEPTTHDVLITQDQPANEPYPERDWLWEFDGRHLRLIAHYKADDAAQVLAIPW